MKPVQVRVRTHSRRRIKKSVFVEQPALSDVDIAAFESARKDFELEDRFADRILAGQARIEEFPFYDDYVRTINMEATLIASPKRILFVGSGPIPLSAILFAKKFPEATVDIMDISPTALRKGAAIARYIGVPLGREIASDAKDFVGYGAYDTVILALEAGPTTETKIGVMHGIFSRIRPGTSVLLRGSLPEGGGDVFIDTRKLLPRNVAILRSVKTWEGQGETVLAMKA